ncbi:MAG: hypothetical protein ACOYMB_02175 [Patescibacteria group bacterium]
MATLEIKRFVAVSAGETFIGINRMGKAYSETELTLALLRPEESEAREDIVHYVKCYPKIKNTFKVMPVVISYDFDEAI